MDARPCCAPRNPPRILVSKFCICTWMGCGSKSLVPSAQPISSRFGVKVDVLERERQPLPREDSELAMALCSQLRDEGIRLEFCSEMHCGEIKKRGKHIHIHGAKGKEEELVANQILVVVGQQPALNALNLETAGVQYTDKGIPTGRSDCAGSIFDALRPDG